MDHLHRDLSLADPQIHRLLLNVAVRLGLAHVEAGHKQQLGAVDQPQVVYHVLQALVLALDAEHTRPEAVGKLQVVMKEVLVDGLRNDQHAVLSQQVVDYFAETYKDGSAIAVVENPTDGYDARGAFMQITSKPSSEAFSSAEYEAKTGVISS